MPVEPIVIDSVHGSKELNHHMLKGCYFYEMEKNRYSFFSKADALLASGLKSGQDFEFTLGPFTWFVRNFVIDPERAHGHWTADIPGGPIIKPPPDRDAEDEGTFTAQAGGRTVEEKVSAASSY